MINTTLILIQARKTSNKRYLSIKGNNVACNSGLVIWLKKYSSKKIARTKNNKIIAAQWNRRKYFNSIEFLTITIDSKDDSDKNKLTIKTVPKNSEISFVSFEVLRIEIAVTNPIKGEEIREIKKLLQVCNTFILLTIELPTNTRIIINHQILAPFKLSTKKFNLDVKKLILRKI